jgi:hypothetical protein
VFEQRTQPPHFGLVVVRLGGFHLVEQRQESLMERDLLGSRLLAVVELGAHGFSTHLQAATIPHLAAVSLMRLLTMPQETKNGFFVHWISSSCAFAS